MGDKLQTLIGDKNPQQNSENIKKARAMAVAPRFNVGDNTHVSKRFGVIQSLQKRLLRNNGFVFFLLPVSALQDGQKKDCPVGSLFFFKQYRDGQ
jgi:hypothetical protein